MPRLSKYTHVVSEAAGIPCPICGQVTYHPEDIRQRFCNACGLFWGDLLELAQAEHKSLQEWLREAAPEVLEAVEKRRME